MGFWPFGGGKRQRTAEVEEVGRETLLRRTPSDTMARREKYGGGAPSLGQTSSRGKREENQARRLSKQRTPSAKALPYAQPSRAQTTPVRSLDNTRRTSRTNSQYNEKKLYQQDPMSQSSLGPENFTVVRQPPTLHAKRSEYDSQIPRRKSSKRKAEDYAREREIRALSSSPIPIPKRPATLYGSGPLERDSRQIPGALNRKLARPTSEVSLPLAGSLPSNIDFRNQNSFKIGILAALSPRPTVRYDANPKTSAGKQPVRPNMAIQQAIAEDDTSDKKRIDELADDLDAGGLRELMERDRRRRERKREAEKMKLQRKLQRRAERQREEEARRARTEAFVRASPGGTPRAHGGVPETSVVSNGLLSEKSTFTAPVNNPFGDPDSSATAGQPPIRNPFEDEQDLDIMGETQDGEVEDSVYGSSPIPIPVRSPLRSVEMEERTPREKPSQSTLSPPVSPVNRAIDRSSLSQGSLLNRETTPSFSESTLLERRVSDQGSQRLSSWTTFFRRGTRRTFAGPSQGRSTPSEFSNTSRESFSRKQPPVVAPRTFRRSGSATPQRTLSRFREDLPELPISPPDSRMQSPEAGAAVENVISTEAGRDDSTSERDSTGLQLAGAAGRFRRSSVELDPSPAGAGMILSQSLASVDSEGSWLSGKPSKRLSNQPSHALKPSQSSLSRPMPGAFDQEGKDSVTEDEQYDRLITTSQPQHFQQQGPLISPKAGSGADPIQEPASAEQTGAPETPSSATEEKWHQGTARRPKVVQQGGRAKSEEGLLKGFATPVDDESTSSDDDDDQDSDTPEEGQKESTIMRAKSVEYRGHVRHISAGSAKLLNISRGSIHSESGRTARKSDPALQTELSSASSPRLE